MARLARVVVPGLPYHVTHRGNARQRGFVDATDRACYLAMLERYSRANGLEVLSWCLMTNHVHLLVVPSGTSSMAVAVGNAHGKYAQWFNAQHGLSGHLWANRYYSTALDCCHLWAAVRYVELNPVRAQMIGRAEDYLYCSAAFHCGRADNLNAGFGGLVSSNSPFPGEVGQSGWSDWLHQGLEQATLEKLRKNTMTGRPSGSDEFVSQMERELKRILRPQPSGRAAHSTEADITADLFS
jgi:putative transposase